MAGDASAFGLGAVLSHIHVNSDGSEHTIAFVSRTLSVTEQNYAQIENEALSSIFGIQKFHTNLYERKFTSITDHKPLLTILGPKTGIPTNSAAWMQRWALTLSAYHYDIVFKNTGEHENADSLSCFLYLNLVKLHQIQWYLSLLERFRHYQ